MKKIIIFLLGFFYLSTFAWDIPNVPKLGLPWDNVWVSNAIWEIGWDLVSLMIKYTAIVAVISLMLAWIYYILSGWEDEKVKKAKNWIMWSLIWVLLSVSAWWIIQLINSLTINT